MTRIMVMMTRPLGDQMDPNSSKRNRFVNIKTTRFFFWKGPSPRLPFYNNQGQARFYLLHFAKRWNGVLCILWGYPPPTNSEIIICSFLWRAPYKPSLSTVSGPGIPPMYSDFFLYKKNESCLVSLYTKVVFFFKQSPCRLDFPR